MNSTPLLQVDGLAAGYFGATVVRDLHMHVHAGQIVALLGPNGAGKTTTLRTIAGLLPTVKGRILLAGQDIGQLNTHDRARSGIVMVSERRGIFRGLTVGEHLKIHYRGQRISNELAYELFPALTNLKNRQAGLLSGGEQQMLGLARAFSREPKVLMIDEMSLGLAPVIVERLLPLIRQIAQTLKTAVLLVEQHVDLALETADYAYVLAHGDNVLEGSASVLAADRHLIQASYMGQRNTPRPPPT
jgi:branched-chain amino acid transport system ATP-binding protein